MNSLERVRSALQRGQPDRVPIAEFLIDLKVAQAAVPGARADGYPGAAGWQPQERISVAAAVAGYTSGAAHAAGLGDQLGTLAPGKLADVTILDRDPTAVPPDELLAIQPLATYVGGELVWER